MNKWLLFLFVVFNTSIFAKSTNKPSPYNHVQLTITNETSHQELVTFFDFIGKWQKPVSKSQTLILKPGQRYQNIISATLEHHHPTTFTSITVSQLDSPRENYLIFAQSSYPDENKDLADIFDGLGSMFVASWTNYCQGFTPDGSVDCQLKIRSNT